MCDFMGARLDLPFQTIVDPPFKPALQVSIDIKPGDVQNSVNPASQGKIPVAVLSTAYFDAPFLVDRTSLTFGRTGSEQSLAFCNAGGVDVNNDGLPDLLCHFSTEATGFTAGDTAGILKGRTTNGMSFTGQDAVTIVPPAGGTADTTPPTVVATEPANGAVGVPVTATMMAVFSEPMNCTTLTSATFVVRDAFSSAVPGTVACGSSTATFTPASALAYSMTYTAVVTTGVTDLAGNAMMSDYTWGFSTAAPPTYTISGTVTNSSADQSHNILIGACQDAAFTICSYATMLPPGPGGPYTITEVPSGTYYVGICVDSNSDGTCVLGNAEPQAVYGGNPVVLTSVSVSGIDITIPGMTIQGEDYWVMAYNVCPNTWPTKPLGEYTEDDWALVRSGTSVVLNWRGRATLGTPDANGNGLIAFTDFWEHRHMVDQTFGGEPWGITPGTGATIITTGYTLSPNNEITIAINGDMFHMAMSRDGNFFTGVLREAGNNCQNMLMAVKAATAPMTVSGLYALVNNYSQLLYVQAPGMPAPAPVATSWGTYGQAIWIDQSVPSARFALTDYLLAYDPTLAGASGHAAVQILTGGGQGPQTTDPDGTMTITTAQGVWHAVSPDGQVRITAQGTNDNALPTTDPSGNTTYRHMLGNQLSLKQDPGVTFTAADVIGTYFLSARRDDVTFASTGTIGMMPPIACANNLTDEPGSAACGTGVHPRWRMSWGYITLNPGGSASINLTEFNDQQQETPLTATGTFTVRKECFGSSGTARLPWDDPVCTGGRILDVLVINIGASDVAKFFIGSGGDVLAFYDPAGFSPVTGLAGQSRWVGAAVRLKTSGASYSVSGMVTNASADQSHNILIGACQDAAFTICSYGTMLPPGAGGPYTIMGVPAGTYYVGACIDSNSNGKYDPGIDPVVSFVANPVTITTFSVMGIDMTIPGGTVHYSISGTVTNASADQSHNILIGACQDASFTLCPYGTVLPPGIGGAYTIAGVPAGTYYVGTCVDANNDNMCVLGNGEPQTVYSGNPLVVTNTIVKGINMTIPGMPIQGEDYWVMEYGICPHTWPAKPLSQYTEDDWALVRTGTEYILNWRGRATVGPTDANGNGLIAFTDFWNHRHMVDQAGPYTWGITPGTGSTMGATGYKLAANNEFTIAINGDVFHMAMSRDGNFFTGVHREAGNACQDMLMAVKAATAPVTVSGLYSLVNNYSMLLYTQPPGMPAPNPAADTLGTYGQVIWADQSVPSARFGMSDYLQTYPVTQAAAGGHTAVQMITGGGQGPQTTDPDGTLTIASGQGVWHAVSPDGLVRITAQGTNDYAPPTTDAYGITLYRHTLGSQLSLKQDPGVTFTAADVVGTYFLSARRDDVALAVPGTIGITPPPSCATYTTDEPGSAACGTGVHPRWKMTWGYVTFDTNGTATMNLTEFNDQQQETPLAATGTFTVRKECLGNSGTSRLPWDDPVCTGGRILDVLVINDGLTDIAKFFIGVGGDVLAFYEPEGFSPVAGLAGQSRWIGSAVRLK
jgi:hypothetical protein